MRSIITVHGRFSASHTVEGHPVCGRLHGHTWDVDVSVEGPISPKTGTVVDSWALAFALTKLTVELDHRDLDAMVPGVVSVPEGIASYVRERLLLEFPKITIVTVSIEDYSARLEWPLR